MQLSNEALISAEAIQRRTAELGATITKNYADRDLYLVCVLKGAAPFTMALLPHLPENTVLDFIRARSYSGAESTGSVDLKYTPDTPVEGRHVLLVEDILDTGRTASALLDWVDIHNPASVKVCTLLDKPSRRVIPVTADYTGFTIDDHFVVGFGLDYDERYRALPDIWTLEE